MWKLESPKGHLHINIEQNSDGELSYNVIKNSKPILEFGTLGIKTNIRDFSRGLSFEKEERNSFCEAYSLPAGKKAEYINEATELALFFHKDNIPFILRLRAYDDGAAFRYEIPAVESDTLLLYCEQTEFKFSERFEKLWLQDWIKTYEGTYNSKGWEELVDQPYGMPALIHDNKTDRWAMINEAAVINTGGAYCSCHLKGGSERNFSIAFAPEECGKPISSPLPFCSPWRLVVVADRLNELVNSTMNYNLNPPSVIEDTSWVKPARSLWAWWEYENGAQLYSESKAYVDFAAAMGFEAVTLDCGWDDSWVSTICDYAKKKGVQIWIWTGMQRLDTEEKASKLIPLWASWGVAGLKVDFFENDSCHTMWQYTMIAELMIKHKMMINFHGATKPMGEGRTWPNLMTTEGILGLEHYKWSDMPNAAHNCTVPFTRNVAGPMDYTPIGFSNKNRNTTLGHQLALPVVFESGVTHYSLSLYYLEAWLGTEFLRRTKSHYDGVKVLSGYPSHHAAILRYIKDEWLIGAITVSKQDLSIPLDFLPNGSFEAEIYEDDDNGEMIQVRRINVTNKDNIELKLIANGGAGIYICKKLDTPNEGILSGYMSDKYVDYMGSNAKLLHGSEPVNWRDEKGFVLNGGAEFFVKSPGTRLCTLRFFYTAVEEWEIKIADSISVVTAKMPASKSSKFFITHEVTFPMREGEQRLVINRLSGSIPAIVKLRLIDNEPQEQLTIGVEQAILTKGAELIETDGVLTAVSLGFDAELHFERVCVPKEGKYILRVDYCGGDSRDLIIEANGIETIKSYLHCTSGWGFPAWNKPEGKEFLIKLKKGCNTIRLFNPNGLISHIRGIALAFDSD